jgi:hypothetical protein
MKRPVDIREGMEDVEIVLEKGNTICGRVVDPGGKPLAGVSLKYIDQANPSSPPWKGSTDAEGRFSWGGAPSHQVSLEVGKAGYIALYGVPVEPDGKEADIVLPYALRVHGTVTDAETGEPVPRCRITSGLGREGSSLRAPNWMGPPKAFEGGTYEMSFYWAMYGTVPALKVEADGYLPELIPSIPLQGTERPLDIQLRKGQGLAGVVLLPDGKPAADARVWLVQKGRHFRLADAMASGATQDESVVTGADGKVALEPWGKVEGAYRPGGRPAVGTGVWIESHHSGENRPTVDFQVKVHCDDEGRFHLDRVLPGRARLVGGMVETSAAGAQANCGAECWVAPGQTLRINLGGTGRPVVGRLVLPKGSEKKLDWASGEGTLTCSLEEPPGMPSIPKETSDLPRKERRKRMSAWLETEEGKAYQDYRRRYYEASLAALKKAPTTTYRLKVAADGSFRLDDVPAGKHELRIHFLTFKQQGSVSVGLPSASYSGTVRVPEMPSGRSDEPLDLGTLVLKLED